MNGGFFPNVVNPKVRPQTQSEEFQTPFFFGGSQTPNALSMSSNFSGSGLKQSSVYVSGCGLKKTGVYVSGCGMTKGLTYKPYTGMNK